ncbi:hypothetical protein A3Q56_07706 [Intoshia linei]|uniref:Inward rectifier potassium channel C-terminal domain-containing protein n=1 Tax=Intoshia linei TaxID=1819745 RepID=A0A177ARF3_9BILA|nr:hypothetical protein A3Q56_07706 [Intoshia linei]
MAKINFIITKARNWCICKVLNCSFGFTLLIVMGIFPLTWILFSSIWYIYMKIHLNQNGTNQCLININNYMSCLLFSIETQQTIGTGARTCENTCSSCTVLIIIQSYLHILISGICVGLVLIRIMYASNRSIQFSKNCTVSSELSSETVLNQTKNYYECARLQFRVADLEKNNLISAKFSLFYMTKGKSQQMIRISVYTNGSDDEGSINLLWPQVCYHPITPMSPLHDLIKCTNLNCSQSYDDPTVGNNSFVSQIDVKIDDIRRKKKNLYDSKTRCRSVYFAGSVYNLIQSMPRRSECSKIIVIDKDFEKDSIKKTQKNNAFKLIVVVDAIIQSTGRAFRFVNKYDGKDVKLNTKFENIWFYNENTHSFVVKHDNFNKLILDY